MAFKKVAEISIDKLEDRKTVTAILHANGYTVGPGKRKTDLETIESVCGKYKLNQPCGTQGSLAKSAVAGYIVRETVQIADSGYGASFRIKACGQKRRLM